MSGLGDLHCRYRAAPGDNQGADLILFVHGIGCSGDDFAGAWDAPELAPHALLAPDLPGSGRSPAATDDAGTMEAHARALRGAVDGLDYARLHIVGHSLGGAPTLLLARDAGAIKLASLVHIEGNLIAEDCSMMSRRTSEMDQAAFVEQKFSRIVAASANSDDPQIQRWSPLLAQCDPASIYRSCCSLVAWSEGGELLEIFRALTVPKIYAYGEHTVLQPVLAAVGEIDKKCFDDTGHFVATENPGAFYPWLAGWLARVCTR